MRLQQLEASLQTQSQEHSKKIEEKHKQQKKVRGWVSKKFGFINWADNVNCPP